MDLKDVPRLLAELNARFPIVRGYKCERMFLDIDCSGDGSLEAWFAQPITTTSRQLVTLIMKDMPSKAWWRYETIDRLIDALEGRLVPEWKFDDEVNA